MHVITGGAYNGKSAWVKRFYELDTKNEFEWITMYDGEKIPHHMESLSPYVIFEGIEQLILQWLDHMDMSNVRAYGKELIEQWSAWEDEGDERKLIIITTDISKGVVPIDDKIRKWRDVTGWFYQDLFKQAERVDLIWYGIAKRLK